nr:uncharacterized protein LOC117153495 [Bombus vancouverensis nearcticus]XP_033183494.1 uncharacterized protein LOC117153495 [Bombus vancouverensis nearcticus]
MGTMRNNFAAVFVLHILMHSTSQSLSLRGTNGNSFKRNSLPGALTLEQRSTSSTIYECLFVDPDLPACDVKWMLNSTEDPTSSRNSFNKDTTQRSRRNVDIPSTMDVVVYTIEGCLPPRIPFSMPSCEGISLDRIVDVQKFRPFTVKGVTKPPFVFPKFNYSRWLSMMTRLRNHVSSKTRNEKRVFKEAFLESIQDRMEGLMTAATTKATTPIAIAANISHTNGSSPNTFIPSNANSTESIVQPRRTLENTSQTSSFASVDNPPILQFHDKINSMKLLSKEFHDHSKVNAADQRLHAIPETPAIPAISNDKLVYERETMEEPANEILNYDNSKKFQELISNARTTRDNSGIVHDFPVTKKIFGAFRRKREIMISASAQEITDGTETRGIAGQTIVQKLRHNGENLSSMTNQFAASKSQKKQFKSLNVIDDEINTSEDVSNIVIPSYSKESNVASVNNDFYGRTDSWKSTWQKTVSPETASRMKYRNRVELSSFRRQ